MNTFINKLYKYKDNIYLSPIIDNLIDNISNINNINIENLILEELDTICNLDIEKSIYISYLLGKICKDNNISFILDRCSSLYIFYLCKLTLVDPYLNKISYKVAFNQFRHFSYLSRVKLSLPGSYLELLIKQLKERISKEYKIYKIEDCFNENKDNPIYQYILLDIDTDPSNYFDVVNNNEEIYLRRNKQDRGCSGIYIDISSLSILDEVKLPINSNLVRLNIKPDRLKELVKKHFNFDIEISNNYVLKFDDLIRELSRVFDTFDTNSDSVIFYTRDDLYFYLINEAKIEEKEAIKMVNIASSGLYRLDKLSTYKLDDQVKSSLDKTIYLTYRGFIANLVLNNIN